MFSSSHFDMYNAFFCLLWGGKIPDLLLLAYFNLRPVDQTSSLAEQATFYSHDLSAEFCMAWNCNLYSVYLLHLLNWEKIKVKKYVYTHTLTNPHICKHIHICVPSHKISDREKFESVSKTWRNYVSNLLLSSPSYFHESLETVIFNIINTYIKIFWKYSFLMETTYQGFVSLFNKLIAAPFYWSYFLINSQHERINKYKAVSDFQASWPVAAGMLCSWCGDNGYNYLLLSVWTQSSSAGHRFVVLLG